MIILKEVFFSKRSYKKKIKKSSNENKSKKNNTKPDKKI